MFQESKLFDNVHSDNYFFLENGRILRNIYELVNALSSMEDQTFSHHVNNERNDFSSWVLHVFDDKNLANKLQKCKTKDDMVSAINKRIFKLEKQTKQQEFEQKKSVKIEPKLDQELSLKEPKKLSKRIESDEKILSKMDDILIKEREIEKREEKIQEIESRIEKKLNKQSKKVKNDNKFFTKEFIQGFIVGLLLTVIVFLTYIKFVY